MSGTGTVRIRGGFTLIEVMVAFSILAIGLLSVAAGQIYAMRGGSQGRHASDAATVAQSQVENFLRLAFDDAALNDTGGLFLPAPGQPVQTVVQAPSGNAVEMSYLLSWRVVDLDAARKSIDVRVTWNEPGRPGRQLVISTARHDDRPTEGS